MGDDVGFFPLPAPEGGEQISLGGEGLPFSITANSDQPEAAAAYLDFVTDAHATEVIAEAGGLPAPKLGDVELASGTLQADFFAAWDQLNSQDAIVPYLDYATPTFYDTITASVQELMAEKADPEQFVSTVNEDYTSFLGTN